MTSLNPQQFLPGLEHLAPASARPESRSEPSKGWSGPLPGQMVLGVHSAEHGQPTGPSRITPDRPFEVDPHGFVREEVHTPGGRVKPSADQAAGKSSVHDLYREYGGGQARSGNPRVAAHWAAQPLAQIHSDTPVHTGQAADTTENKLEGRQRINAIRGSLRSGEEIREPAWLVKSSGRLFSMDGHHRIVASREEGRPTYPAHVWDMDK